MKQRDAAVSAQDNRGGTSDTKLAQKSGADSAAAVAAATAAAALQQQRARGLEEKVADLQSKLEHALAEKDRCQRGQYQHTHGIVLLFSHVLEGANKMQSCAQRMLKRQRPTLSKWRQSLRFSHLKPHPFFRSCNVSAGAGKRS